MKQRLSYIERIVYWNGHINRNDLQQKFGISVPQSTKDFKAYLNMAPDNLYYNRNKRSYIPKDETFEFRFEENKPENILEYLTAQEPTNIYFLPPIKRKYPLDTIKAITRALNNKQTLKIKYQTLKQEKPETRTVVPVSIGYFMRRYHIRSFCYNRNEYRDFVLSRILDAKPTDKKADELPLDMPSLETLTLVVRPHAKLSAAQKKCIELDFDMTEGFGTINIKKNMLIYLLEELNLLPEGLEPPFCLLQLVNKDILEHIVSC